MFFFIVPLIGASQDFRVKRFMNSVGRKKDMHTDYYRVKDFYIFDMTPRWVMRAHALSEVRAEPSWFTVI